MPRVYYSSFIGELRKRLEESASLSRDSRALLCMSVIEAIGFLREPDSGSQTRFVNAVTELSVDDFFSGNKVNAQYLYTNVRCAVNHEGFVLGLIVTDFGERPATITDMGAFDASTPIGEDTPIGDWKTLPIKFIVKSTSELVHACEQEFIEKFGEEYQDASFDYNHGICVDCKAIYIKGRTGNCPWSTAMRMDDSDFEGTWVEQPDGERVDIKAIIKQEGVIWIFHRFDADPWPSNPHGHVREGKRFQRGAKLCVKTGKVYSHLTKREVGSIKRKKLLEIRSKLEEAAFQLPALEI